MILGAIVGDIIGSCYERNNIKTKDFDLVSKYSTFTDDSVMTIAVARALRKFEKGSSINEDDFEKVLIHSMQKLGKKYPYAGYGGGFQNWLRAKNPQPYNSWGNGSAMRVSAVAWYFDDLDTVEKFAELTAKVTHNHPEGIKGAQATAAAIFLARTGKSKDEIKNYITEKYHYDLTKTCDEIRPDYKFDVSCEGTVPQAITAFLEGENFEDAVRTAVSLGGDSDTLTCITAAISQGMWGIPVEIENLIMPKLDDYLRYQLEKWTDALSAQETNETKHEKVKNGITELVFILDRSGSMTGLESDTIGGFNSTIAKQKKQPGEAYVSTILFDHEQIVLHDRVKLSEIREMTLDDYETRGSTALIDAIGKSIKYISNIHKYARPEDVPENTIFVIITDGYENSSKKYSSSKVKSIIKHQQEAYDWEFLFLGANIDSVETASELGISADRAANYISDSQGTGVAYDSVNYALSMRRANRRIADDWNASVNADYCLRYSKSKSHDADEIRKIRDEAKKTLERMKKLNLLDSDTEN